MKQEHKEELKIFSSLAGLLIGLVILLATCSKDAEVKPGAHPADKTKARVFCYTPAPAVTVPIETLKVVTQHNTYLGHIDGVMFSWDTTGQFQQHGRFIQATIVVTSVPNIIRGGNACYTEPNEFLNGQHVWSPFYDDLKYGSGSFTQFSDRGFGILYGGSGSNLLQNQPYLGCIVRWYQTSGIRDTTIYSQFFAFQGPKFY